jgi:hypothetical protein
MEKSTFAIEYRRRIVRFCQGTKCYISQLFKKCSLNAAGAAWGWDAGLKICRIWGLAGGFEFGVFGVVGVGEAGAGAGIVGGALDAGLGAGGGPPAGGVLF